MNQLDPHLVLCDWLTFCEQIENESLDLMYVDPPFNTGKVQSASAGAYQDSWPSTDSWVCWFEERIRATIPKLKQTGSVLIHVDWRTSHRVRVLLEEILGEEHFVNHLIWSYGLGGSSPRRFARKHDDILFYCKDPKQYYFDPPMIPATSNRMKGKLKKATDVIDIPSLNNMADERVGYPTQKPLDLLKMLIRACSPIDGTIFDPCFGSGTSLVASKILGREFVGCDLNPDALKIASDRLVRVQKEHET
ncbi:MAG: site-specific DNA-methyltransferase [Phycisphaerales bacterium]|nr:site-specific DNA-methyltransferase [Phycisphaerales bacterium]